MSKEPEDSLHRRAELLRAVIRGAPFVMFGLDREGRFTLSEGQALSLIGLAPGQVVGMSAFELYADVPEMAAQLRRALAGETVHYRSAIGRVWFDATYVPTRDAAGNVDGVVGVAFDITEQVHAEQALQLSQSQLREAQRIAQLGSWELDLRANALSWSDEIFRIFEIDPGQFDASYDAFLAAVHPDDRDLVNDTFMRSVALREPYQIIHRLLMADGRIKHVEERGETFYGPDGSPARSVGTVQDVTKERQAELSLQASEAQLEATLQAVPDLLFELDRSGRYLAVRAQRSELLAAPTEQLLGRTIRDVLPADGAEVVERALGEASIDGVSFGRAFRLELAGGERWFELSIARKPGPEGREDTYVVVSRDITERKKAEDAMKRALAEKSLLLREVHHRVKNNLQIVSSLLHLQGNKTKDPASRALFDESRQRVRAIATAHEFLSQSDDLSRIDFASYLRTVTRGLVASHAPAGDALRISVDAEEGFLDIQLAIPCGLIVNELLTNVLKYAFPGGRTGELRVAFRRSATSHWVLSVADDGVGLPEAVDPGAAQTLGLKLVHTLAAQLDGSLRVDRTGGTRFELTFPG